MPTYEEYKTHRGELTEAQFKQVLEERYTSEQYEEAFKVIGECTRSLPRHTVVRRVATLHVLFPEKGSMWKLAEAYLTLGRFGQGQGGKGGSNASLRT